MYIRSVQLENIRCIERLDLAFEEGHEAGWHVLIGENGSGKTTVARAIAAIFIEYLGLIGVGQIPSKWLRAGKQSAQVIIDIIAHPGHDMKFSEFEDYAFRGVLPITKSRNGEFVFGDRPKYYQIYLEGNRLFSPDYRGNDGAWFFAGFGPFRVFKSSGNPFDDSFHKANPRTIASISLFRNDIGFSEIETWLKNMQFQTLEGKSNGLSAVVSFINEGQLLPNGIKIDSISSDGVVFSGPNGITGNTQELSDGYQSVLSLTLELIRQLARFYGEAAVFSNINDGVMTIPVPGVVIIDEADAHLHPTWQTQIGQWFTKYFPNLQFIVTTHSPLICRACGEHGKIFRLAAPGSKHKSEEITGVDRDRLVYGDILAAYETDAFGDKVEWGQEGRDLQKEYRDLAYKRRFGVELTEEETKQYERLKAIFKSNVEIS